MNGIVLKQQHYYTDSTTVSVIVESSVCVYKSLYEVYCRAIKTALQFLN